MTSTSTIYTDYQWITSSARVATSTVQSIDSNKKPLVYISCNGLLLATNKPTYKLKLIFSGSSYPKKDVGGYANGTFCIGEKVFNAVKVIKTAWMVTQKTLLIDIDLRTTYKIINIRKPTRFSFSININDLNCNSANSAISFAYCAAVLN